MTTDTYEAKVGDTVEGWLCYPTYFPSEGDTERAPRLRLRKEGAGNRAGKYAAPQITLAIPLQAALQ